MNSSGHVQLPLLTDGLRTSLRPLFMGKMKTAGHWLADAVGLLAAPSRRGKLVRLPTKFDTLLSRHPGIVRCADTEDVITAVCA